MSTIAVPEDPGDAAGVLFDAVALDAATDAAFVEHTCDAKRHEIGRVAGAVLSAQAFDPALVDLTTREGRLIALVALDVVLAQASRDLVPPGALGLLPAVYRRAVRTGRLDSGRIPGAVLPRRAVTARAGPPDYLTDALMSFVRVSEDSWNRVNLVVASGNIDLPGYTRAPLTVGCAPGLDSLAEFSVTEGGAPGKLKYRLGPGDIPADRIPTLLNALDASGASLAVLPEAIIDDEQVLRWSSTLRDVDPPSPPVLRWLLIGTGPVGGGDPPANRAVLMDRLYGTQVATQKKRARFTLADHNIDNYRLRRQLPTKGDHAEDIERGQRLTIIESNAGRFCILICEDANRLMQDGPLLLAIAPTHIIIPIFSREIKRRDWVDNDAEKLADQLGAGVVVSNSLAVARARESDGEDLGDWGTSLFVMPYHPTRPDALHRSNSATDVRTEAVTSHAPKLIP